MEIEIEQLELVIEHENYQSDTQVTVSLIHGLDVWYIDYVDGLGLSESHLKALVQFLNKLKD